MMLPSGSPSCGFGLRFCLQLPSPINLAVYRFAIPIMGCWTFWVSSATLLNRVWKRVDFHHIVDGHAKHAETLDLTARPKLGTFPAIRHLIVSSLYSFFVSSCFHHLINTLSSILKRNQRNKKSSISFSVDPSYILLISACFKFSIICFL